VKRSVLIVLFLALSRSSHGQAAPPAVPAGPLGDFDSSFLDVYTQRIREIAQTHPTYIEMTGSDLILHRGDKAEKTNVLPDIYQALKDVAHIPFTTYLALSSTAYQGEHLPDERVAELQQLSGKISAARDALDTGHFSGPQLVRQQQMINASLQLLQTVIATRVVDRSALRRFARAMGPLVMMDSNEAGCAQIQAMHAQMMKWKTQMTPDEWSHLLGIIKSGHQPRYRNVATQYFSWLFNVRSPAWMYPGEGQRLIYAESLPTGIDTEDELISIMIDADASVAFFGNRWRLSEDILSDGAARCIAQLPVGDRAYH
jgi:hypothetical protein